MPAANYNAAVLANGAAGENVMLLTARWDETTPAPAGGQVYMLRAWKAEEAPLLSRPISVHRFDREKKEISFLYEVRGTGTQKLAALRPGDTVALTGPSGRGFPVDGTLGGAVALVGGGIGTAPLLQLAAELAAQELGAQYPEFADQISENLAAFCEKLSSLQDYGEQALSDLSCRQLVTFHDGFSYFADAFSLTIAAAMEVESGSEPSAKELEEIISIVEENQIPAVFTEVNGETGAAEVVAGEAGCAVRTLDMAISNRDYFAAMRQNIDIVKEALG